MSTHNRLTAYNISKKSSTAVQFVMLAYLALHGLQ